MYEMFQKLLDERGATAYQVSKATGISTGSLTDWKKGRSSPKIENLQKIADYFGVTIDYFYGKVEQKKENPPGGEYRRGAYSEGVRRAVGDRPEDRP